MPRRFHQAMVLIHRYVGLTIAVFLFVACLTGSVVVFKRELDALLNPGLFRTPAPAAGAQPINPLVLRESLEKQLPPGVTVWEAPLRPVTPGRSVMFNLNWEGPPDARPMDQAYIDPYTGRLLGTRNHLRISESWRNLIPFLFEVHYSLALGEVGDFLLGAMAVLWTVDCFVAAYLTFPTPVSVSTSAKRRSWLTRWRPAWLIQASSLYSTIFTFHRASGLWVWPLLLLFAWSSVALRMRPVYTPVMQLFFPAHEYVPFEELPTARHHPRLSWAEAYERGQAYMDAEAKRRGFTIVQPYILSHEPDFGDYRYQVQSSLDPTDVWCDTVVWIDSDTGEFIAFDAPTGGETGRTVTTWIVYLHFGWVGGLAFRVLIFVVGLIGAALCVTGVIIWWKKRQGRIRKRLAENAPRRAVSGSHVVRPTS